MSSSVCFLNLDLEAGGGLAVKARGVDLHWILSMKGVVGIASARWLSMTARECGLLSGDMVEKDWCVIEGSIGLRHGVLASE